MTEPSAGVHHRRRDDAVPLYEDLARRFARAIESGALRPGDQLPSVRTLRMQERVSTATVMQALARLESLGLARARPRSGYFVQPVRQLAAPAPTRPPRSPRPVTVASLITRILETNRDERLVALGPASPSPALLPVTALSRALGAATRPGTGAALAYEPTAGYDRLRRAISRRALSWGLAVSPEEVVVTAGTSEAIHLALRAVAAPGDVVAIESPAYFGTLQSMEALGLRAVEVPCRADSGMDLDALERILDRHRVKAVLAVPNFSNPTGSLMPEASKRRLVELLAARDLPLVEDDVFGDLSFAGDRPPCAKAFDRRGLVLTCGSFSKTLAPGWRVGYLLPGRHLERALLLKFALNVSTSAGPQRAVARFLESGSYDRHVRRLRAALQASAERMIAAIAASFPAGTRVSRPSGGLALWIELPPAVDALDLYERALEAGVSVTPGQLFGPAGGFEHFIRVSFARPWDERLARAVDRLGRIACELAGGGATT
jgi:DNA-binding transcriptional MocR family regulator